MKALGFLVLLPLLFRLQSFSNVTHLIEACCNKHGDTCSSEEEKQQRLQIFEENYTFVKQHNEMAAGDFSYRLSLNASADLTHHEFKASHLGLAAAPTCSARRNVGVPGEVVGDFPALIDWSDEGAVTYVKNQGTCGASSAFASTGAMEGRNKIVTGSLVSLSKQAATGAMEGRNKIVTGSLVSLSKQKLIDCHLPHNQSFEVGLMDYAYQFFIDKHGINTGEEYRFPGHDWACHKDFLTHVPANNETLPVSAMICVRDREFVFYYWGRFTCPCSTSTDQAVLIEGYGSLDGEDYWIAKKTWGSLAEETCCCTWTIYVFFFAWRCRACFEFIVVLLIIRFWIRRGTCI